MNVSLEANLRSNKRETNNRMSIVLVFTQTSEQNDAINIPNQFRIFVFVQCLQVSAHHYYLSYYYIVLLLSYNFLMLQIYHALVTIMSCTSLKINIV